MTDSMKTKILVIDDDEKLNRLLVKYLGANDYDVTTATAPSAGLAVLRRLDPGLVVLDVMLPEMNGFEVCKRIRAESRVPILMLTARGDVMDRVVGLELGADDYLAKPFEPRELLARIQSVLRRTTEVSQGRVLESGPLRIDLVIREVTLDGVPVRLTTTEYDSLVFLASNPGKVFNRDQLLDHFRGVGLDAYYRTFDVTLSRLRNKLNDNPKSPRFLKTIWGTGYMFIGKVEHKSV